MRSRSKAFTLIELLVVIAIIAILAAILFPVFAQAKAAAKHTTNLSSVKQIATATQMYVTDYDDVFLCEFNHDSLNDYGEWQWFLQPYMKNRQMVYDVNRTRKGCDIYIDPSGRCIGFAPNFGVWDYKGGTGMFDRATGNFPITTSFGGTQNGRMWRGKNMTVFESPADMMMFTTTADTPMFTNSFYFQDGDGQLKEPRNGGRWVQAYTDGHAKTVMFGAYTILGTYMQMPKSTVDANKYCENTTIVEQPSEDGSTSPFTGMTCNAINSYLTLNRIPK